MLLMVLLLLSRLVGHQMVLLRLMRMLLVLDVMVVIALSGHGRCEITS